MKKISLYLYLVLFFSPIHLNAKIIFCYQVSNNYEKQNLLNFHNNPSYAETIVTYEINDKKKELYKISQYYFDNSILPKTKGHSANSFYYSDIEISKFGYKKIENVEKYKFKDFISFDENKIISVINYKDKDGNKKRSYLELDRVSGILIDTYGININDSDEEYVEDDGNIYIRGDLYFNYHVYSDKFICENHKGI